MPSLTEIQHTLSQASPTLISPPPTSRRAAVALIIDGASNEPHFLYIRRAFNPSDPWSGHLAFPGGRYEDSDRDMRATAIRETHEEVGIDLTNTSHARELGRLDDVQGRARGAAIDLIISCFVFVVNERPGITIDPSEVDSHYWISVSHLLTPSRQVAYDSPRHASKPYPGIQITDASEPVLWGLTYRFTRELLTIANAELPEELA